MLIVDVKKYITPFLIDILNGKRFGIEPDRKSASFVKQLFLDSLECSKEKIICVPIQECPPKQKSFKCDFSVSTISHLLLADLEPDQLNVWVEGYVNGEPPYTYSWTFDPALFTVIGSSTTSMIKLRWKKPVPLGLINTVVKCVITDVNSCAATKILNYSIVVTPSIYPMVMEEETGYEIEYV